MVDIMGNEALEVIKWYEEQLGRKLTEAEKLSIRGQCVEYDLHTTKTKDLEQFGIRLGGLRYGQQ